MIVQPDFLDHWKTLRLASVLSDPLAPVYIIRLWGYVQTRRCDVLPDDAEMVKAVCRWPGCAVTFHAALLSCGWLEKTEAGLLVHGWSELNARLIHNWTVGAHGGRPRLPVEKPKGKSKGLPNETDKIGLELIGVDKKNIAVKKPRERNILMDAMSECDGGPDGITGPTWGKIAKSLSLVKEASPDVTPDEIRRRAKNYRTHFTGAVCTSTALASHWAKCKDAAIPVVGQFGRPLQAPKLSHEEMLRKSRELQ